MDFIKEWKEKELEGYKKARDYYIEHKDELKELEEKAKSEFFEAARVYMEMHKAEPVKTRTTFGMKYEDETLDKLYNQKENAHYEYIQFAYNKNQFYCDYAYSSKFEEVCRKLIDKHFDQLQAKVEKKIGKINRIESLGGDDYLFEGELDNCKVEVVWAGGYNIQRLHTRWLVKNYKSRK